MQQILSDGYLQANLLNYSQIYQNISNYLNNPDFLISFQTQLRIIFQNSVINNFCLIAQTHQASFKKFENIK